MTNNSHYGEMTRTSFPRRKALTRAAADYVRQLKSNKTEKPISPKLLDNITIQKYSKIFLNIQKYSGIFQNILEYSKIFRNIPKYSGIFQNIQEYSEIIKNIPNHSGTFQYI